MLLSFQNNNDCLLRSYVNVNSCGDDNGHSVHLRLVAVGRLLIDSECELMYRKYEEYGGYVDYLVRLRNIDDPGTWGLCHAGKR